MYFSNQGIAKRPLKKERTDTLTMTPFGIARKSAPDKAGTPKAALEAAKNAARNKCNSASIIAAYTGKDQIDTDAKNYEIARRHSNESI